MGKRGRVQGVKKGRLWMGEMGEVKGGTNVEGFKNGKRGIVKDGNRGKV